jgi:uncharacterized protein (DUF2461 family)
MSTVSEISEFQTIQFEEVPLQILFHKQKAYFATDVTKTYEWRVDQLDRLIRMLKDNYERFSNAARKDFKTASARRATLKIGERDSRSSSDVEIYAKDNR